MSIQAMLLEGGALFYRPRQHAKEADARHAYFARDGQGDHITLLNIWNEFVEAGYSHAWARENYLNPRAFETCPGCEKSASAAVRTD
jgi:pre-mRNA-splicing factor ATP-dependent RNA helicase DHX16